jgi:hypothetical protein
MDIPDHYRLQQAPGTGARLTRALLSPRQERRKNQGPWNPVHPARQPGFQPQPAAKNGNPATEHVSDPRSRKIEASNRFGQLAYVTFVHEPLLQCAGVPKIGPLAVPLMMKLSIGA